jgi:hypothetical protein
VGAVDAQLIERARVTDDDWVPPTHFFMCSKESLIIIQEEGGNWK